MRRILARVINFFSKTGDVFRKVYVDLADNHTMAMAAGLSYYFVMSLFPLLIVAAAAMAFLPIPDLFDRIIGAMATVVPPDSMGIVRSVLKDVISPNKGSFLTFGILGTLWAATGGFSSLIEALNVAYNVPETRPLWKTKLLALALMFVTGTLMVVGVLAMWLGPQFGAWLAARTNLSYVFADMWPVLRWVVALAFVVLAVELIFYWAPNVKQRFLATLPGAAMGVGFWIGTSFLLGIYFRNFAHYNKTYGALAGAVALMAWFYYSWLVILVGAEFNSELLKISGHGSLPLKQPPPHAIRVRPAWEADLRTDEQKAKETGNATDMAA